jgi:excisionase family DNA binding protein
VWRRFLTEGEGPSLTLAEAAAALGVSVATVRRLISQGKLDATRTSSGRLRVSPKLAPPRELSPGEADVFQLWQELKQLSVALQETRAERDGLKAEVEALRTRLEQATKERVSTTTLLGFARSEVSASVDGREGIKHLILYARRKSRRRLWLWRLSA